MTHAIVSLNDATYQPLADLTWNQNKLPYAEKHGYLHECKTDSFFGINIGFEKILFIINYMNLNPEAEWVWWVGTDTVLTNTDVRIEDRIDNNYHFIVATDCNGINVDSFFVRNSVEGRLFLSTIAAKFGIYKSHYWFEQQAIIDSYEQFKSIIKIVPQRDINSYDYNLYPQHAHHPTDLLGNNGQWQSGDFLIHFPGTTLEHRLELAKEYLQKVL